MRRMSTLVQIDFHWEGVDRIRPYINDDFFDYPNDVAAVFVGTRFNDIPKRPVNEWQLG